MPTRRIMLMTVIVGSLLIPARATVRAWGKRQLMAGQPGTIRHGVGEVLVTIT